MAGFNGFNEQTQQYSTPSLAKEFGYSLQRCVRIFKSDGIKSDKTKDDYASAFTQFYESDWNDLISSRARQTLNEKKHNTPKMLPLCEYVYKWNSHLKKEIKILSLS